MTPLHEERFELGQLEPAEIEPAFAKLVFGRGSGVGPSRPSAR